MFFNNHSEMKEIKSQYFEHAKTMGLMHIGIVLNNVLQCLIDSLFRFKTVFIPL